MATKKELLQQEVAKAVGAGKVVSLETVDFNDPNRPKTCLEVDFPILSVNQVATIEAASGAAKKPIYQMSKYWARRQSSVFRSMLLAAATKSPEDKSYASKQIWENYYANHQKRGAFEQLKVADIFMGGGTTLVEGSRLGMQMIGNDLNPVAWFVVKQELSNINIDEVRNLIADIETEVKPQIMPYYYCDGPEGEKGNWTYLPTGKVMPSDFDPLTIPRDERKSYRYEGPEVIYTFWAKHGPCQVTGCGHRTPIMSSPVVAMKTISVKHWEHACANCGTEFHVEEESARIAPDVPMYVAPSVYPFSIFDNEKGVICPKCNHSELLNLGKGKNKKVELTLLVHPQWIAGSPKSDINGGMFGGTAQDDLESSRRWSIERAKKIQLLEVRGTLPDEVTCPETKITFSPKTGTVPKKSHYTCAACGTVQDVLTTIKATGKTGPLAGYAVQGYSPYGNEASKANNGRFFATYNAFHAQQQNAAHNEWEARKNDDLKDFWPRSELSLGWKTHGWAIPEHGLTHYWTMFNPRQLLVHAQLLKAIVTLGNYDWTVREYVLGAFQQYLRCNNTFSIWHVKNNQISAALSNNNFHPRSTNLEPSVFNPVGDGSWKSAFSGLFDAFSWKDNPWELVSAEGLSVKNSALASEISGKSEKVFPKDYVTESEITCGSSTSLSHISDSQIDLVITDPPFGGILQYAELADFFYVWLRLALKGKYPEVFGGEYTPKSLEAVANPFREPDDPNGFYQRLLTNCWQEAHRILKPGGILAFTFHHDDDDAWVAVLKSLFDAGFYLEATYPVRSDETKGETAAFGSQKIEYDIIHVCRKRIEEPKSVSWGRMRREVMADVRQLQAMLENHAKEGLPAADIQVIRRGKALEYFSRHYGKVYVDEGRPIDVRDALIGINQLIDDDADKGKEPPPINAEPMTRQFLRTFGTSTELKRDQFQKFLRGSITTTDDFVQRGWCSEVKKVFTRTSPLDFARDWQGKHKRKLTSDLDQALVLIGACVDGSGINAADTLKNENFKPHVALKPLLEWLQKNSPDQTTRNAASRAVSIFNTWQASLAPKPMQGSLFDDEEYA